MNWYLMMKFVHGLVFIWNIIFQQFLIVQMFNLNFWSQFYIDTCFCLPNLTIAAAGICNQNHVSQVTPRTFRLRYQAEPCISSYTVLPANATLLSIRRLHPEWCKCSYGRIHPSLWSGRNMYLEIHGFACSQKNSRNFYHLAEPCICVQSWIIPVRILANLKSRWANFFVIGSQS